MLKRLVAFRVESCDRVIDLVMKGQHEGSLWE